MPILRAISPKRVMSRLSVRTRIIAITLIPVAGFLAIAAAYIAGAHNVERAVEEARQATALADASREFKTAVGNIKGAARSFATHPQASYLQALEDSQTAAMSQFALIRDLGGNDQEANLDAIERTLARLEGNLRELQKEYQRLAGDDDAGIRFKLNQGRQRPSA